MIGSEECSIKFSVSNAMLMLEVVERVGLSAEIILGLAEARMFPPPVEIVYPIEIETSGNLDRIKIVLFERSEVERWVQKLGKFH